MFSICIIPVARQISFMLYNILLMMGGGGGRGGGGDVSFI